MNTNKEDSIDRIERKKNLLTTLAFISLLASSVMLYYLADIRFEKIKELEKVVSNYQRPKTNDVVIKSSNQLPYVIDSFKNTCYDIKGFSNNFVVFDLTNYFQKWDLFDSTIKGGGVQQTSSGTYIPYKHIFDTSYHPKNCLILLVNGRDTLQVDGVFNNTKDIDVDN